MSWLSVNKWKQVVWREWEEKYVRERKKRKIWEWEERSGNKKKVKERAEGEMEWVRRRWRRCWFGCEVYNPRVFDLERDQPKETRRRSPLSFSLSSFSYLWVFSTCIEDGEMRMKKRRQWWWTRLKGNRQQKKEEMSDMRYSRRGSKDSLQSMII